MYGATEKQRANQICSYHYYTKIRLQSCGNQVTLNEKMADEQVPCVGCARSTVPRQRWNLKSDSSSMLFEIAAYVSSASLLIMLTKRKEKNFLRTLLLAEFLEHLISSDESLSHPLRKRARSVDTTYSSTAAAATSSPPISVCHKWCYISLVFICVGKRLESQ